MTNTETTTRARPDMPAHVEPSRHHANGNTWFWYCGFCVDRDGGYGWAPVSAAHDAARAHVRRCADAQAYIDEFKELVA